LFGLSPNFNIHVYVSDLYILTFGPPIFLQQNRQTDQKNYDVNRSQKHECRDWDVTAHFLSWEYLFRIFGIVFQRGRKVEGEGVHGAALRFNVLPRYTCLISSMLHIHSHVILVSHPSLSYPLDDSLCPSLTRSSTPLAVIPLQLTLSFSHQGILSENQQVIPAILENRHALHHDRS
jgi:hypothetical protein